MLPELSETRAASAVPELSRRSNAAALRVIRQWQSPTEEIRHAPDPIGVRFAVWSLTACLMGAVGASPFILIDRTVTSSSGKIVSTTALTTYQALDTSIVRRIDVKEGQQVKKGQLLATLDPTITEADVDQLRQQSAGLDAEIARTQAEQRNSAFSIPQQLGASYLPYWQLQRSLFEQRSASYVSQIKSLDEKIASATATLVKMQSDVDRYTERDKIVKQVEGMRSMLFKSGASSLASLLEATDARVQLLQSLDSSLNGISEARHQLASAQADREAFVKGWQVSIGQELVAALNAKDTATASLGKAERHQDLVRLTASSDSVVLSISKLSGGSILKQGDEILKLARTDVPVEAELNIPAQSIGFVRAGDRATIKVDAYNSYEYGIAEGHVSWISEGAFSLSAEGQETQPFYKLRVHLDRLVFQNVPDFRLVPGMTLTANVKVGTRSVFSYILGGGFFRHMVEPMRDE